VTGALRSGALAAAAGVNPQTVRYYERRGLLDSPDRTPGGHRLYPPEAVTVLRVVKAAQRLGFSLHEIADLIEAGRHKHARPSSLHDQLAAKLAEVESRIADLELIRETLVAGLDAGCDDVVTCSSTDGCPLPFGELATRPLPDVIRAEP
jgi:DNA-binding transcriptional MerR regulator